MTKLRDSQNQSMTRAAFRSPLGAAVHADGTQGTNETAGEPVDPAFIPPFPENSFIKIEVPDRGRAMHFGVDNDSATYPHSEMYFLASDSWHELAWPAFPFHAGVGFVINGKAYFFGGFFEWREDSGGDGRMYDPAIDSWIAIAHAPVLPGEPESPPPDGPFPSNRIGAAAEAVTEYGNPRHGRNGFIFGGRKEVAGQHTYHSSMHRYDAGLDQWVAGAGGPNPSRASMASTALNGDIYSFGGVKSAGGVNETIIDNADKFSPGSDAWSARAPLTEADWINDTIAPGPRHRAAATSLHGTAHLLGGLGESIPGGFPMGRHDQYMPELDTWQVIAATDIPGIPDDPDPAPGWPGNWPSKYLFQHFIDAAAFTLRGGVHLTGGAIGDKPWDEPISFNRSSTHARWLEGSWSLRQDVPGIAMQHRRRGMGTGWVSAGDEPPVNEAVVLESFGRLEDDMKDARHVVLTL